MDIQNAIATQDIGIIYELIELDLDGEYAPLLVALVRETSNPFTADVERALDARYSLQEQDDFYQEWVMGGYDLPNWL